MHNGRYIGQLCRYSLTDADSVTQGKLCYQCLLLELPVYVHAQVVGKKYACNIVNMLEVQQLATSPKKNLLGTGYHFLMSVGVLAYCIRSLIAKQYTHSILQMATIS